MRFVNRTVRTNSESCLLQSSKVKLKSPLVKAVSAYEGQKVFIHSFLSLVFKLLTSRLSCFNPVAVSFMIH
jgi:hypothetical protein